MVYDRPAVQIRLRDADGAWRVTFADGCEFLIEDDASRLTAFWDPPQTFEDAAAYARSGVLSLILRLRNRVCLHASSVRLEGGAALLMGHSGAGKSTLAAAMVRDGAEVLADDMAVVDDDDGWIGTHHGDGAVRLSDDSATLVLGPGQEGRRTAPHWPKLRFSFRTDPTPDERVPVSAIYLIEPAAELELVGLDPRAGLEEVWQHLRPHGSVPLPPRFQERAFRVLSNLANRIPVSRVRVPRDFSKLQSVCAAIREHAAEIAARPEADPHHLGADGTVRAPS